MAAGYARPHVQHTHTQIYIYISCESVRREKRSDHARSNRVALSVPPELLKRYDDFYPNRRKATGFFLLHKLYSVYDKRHDERSTNRFTLSICVAMRYWETNLTLSVRVRLLPSQCCINVWSKGSAIRSYRLARVRSRRFRIPAGVKIDLQSFVPTVGNLKLETCVWTIINNSFVLPRLRIRLCI